MDPKPTLPTPARVAPPRTGALRRFAVAFVRWFDTTAATASDSDDHGVDWLRVIPFVGMHLACFGVIWVGFSWFAFWTAVVTYALRMFAITAFYHRYFSHKSFRTSRVMQFVFGVLGATCVQRGPLWWAAHHRNHHLHADTERDVHSPVQHGFLWSHMGWFLTRAGFRTDLSRIRDLSRFPELVLLDRFDVLVPIAFAALLFGLGGYLETHAPQLHTSASQLLVWGFFISTVVLFHASVTINSLAHQFGTRRYPTRDESRNNWWLAVITFGEGWHNNHHQFPGSARQGVKWWEYDLTYYLLRLLAVFGLVWDLITTPDRSGSARGAGTAPGSDDPVAVPEN